MLDISTERGQVSLQYENIVMRLLQNKYSSSVIQTPKNLDAKCDGLIVNPDGTMNSIYEFKCRDNLWQHEDGIYYHNKNFQRKEDTWLVTHEKILSCVDVASKLRIPFIGILHLINSNIVYQFHISDAYGKYLFPFEVQTTKTQKTINGGSISRENAFLPFKYAVPILLPSDFDTQNHLAQ